MKPKTHIRKNIFVARHKQEQKSYCLIKQSTWSTDAAWQLYFFLTPYLSQPIVCLSCTVQEKLAMHSPHRYRHVFLTPNHHHPHFATDEITSAMKTITQTSGCFTIAISQNSLLSLAMLFIGTAGANNITRGNDFSHLIHISLHKSEPQLDGNLVVPIHTMQWATAVGNPVLIMLYISIAT